MADHGREQLLGGNAVAYLPGITQRNQVGNAFSAQREIIDADGMFIEVPADMHGDPICGGRVVGSVFHYFQKVRSGGLVVGCLLYTFSSPRD